MSVEKDSKVISEAEKTRLQIGINLSPDEALMKDMTKLVTRMEKIAVPGDSMVVSTIVEQLKQVLKKVQSGNYFIKTDELILKLSKDFKPVQVLTLKVNWVLFESEITSAMSDGASDFVLPKRLKEEIDEEKYIQEEKVSKIMKEDKKKRLQVGIQCIISFFPQCLLFYSDRFETPSLSSLVNGARSRTEPAHMND
jgi:hypothetical protein